MTPRGLTLLECLIGMTMASALMAATCSVLLAGHRSAISLISAIEARQNLEVTASIIRGEVRQAAAGELLRANDSSIVLRALRGTGYACAIDTGGGRVLVADAEYSRLRAIDPLRDSLRLLLENDADSISDDAWGQMGIASAGSGVCPDGRSALAITIGGGSLAQAAAGAPLRIVEVVEYRSYADASGDRWFGTRSPSSVSWSAMSPISGPLVPGRLRLGSPDSLGAVASVIHVLDRLQRADSLALLVRGPP